MIFVHKEQLMLLDANLDQSVNDIIHFQHGHTY